MTASYKPDCFMADSRIPLLLKDTDTIADIFNGLHICLDMVYQSDYVDGVDILDDNSRRRMLMFCKAVCNMATDYSNDKVDEVLQHYTRK